MIYMRNITITTAKSATYLENVGGIECTNEKALIGGTSSLKAKNISSTLERGAPSGKFGGNNLEVSDQHIEYNLQIYLIRIPPSPPTALSQGASRRLILP